jgi:diaminohydroxyphosphoribosylaminopyrimidine deaminase/5-amino-6-(5-phosphoribosylamino)uracil reductase
MLRCLELAKKSFGQTYPNPMVGCVIVHEEKIISEGWHHKAGEPHAEVNAINNLKDESLIKESTIYVSLEPCSHYGKTPPCADLIVEKGFKKVVIGMTDPFAKVKGRGIKKLFENGCHVTVGICEAECAELNKRFITFHEKQRPFVILKWAESKDGFLSPFEYGKETHQNPVWLTNSVSKQKVHQWRSEEQAILVGKHTALMDNPALTTRHWHGKNPLRILIDKNLDVPASNAIFSEDAETLVFTAEVPQEISKANIDYVQINFEMEVVPQILNELYQREIQSLIVEGGKITLESFIKANLWDEARVFLSPKILKRGTSAPEFNFESISSETILGDELRFYRNAFL